MNSVLLMLAAHLAVMSSQFGSNIQVTDDVWNSYKVDYDKQYSSVAEEALRRQVFAYNLHQIDTFNRENPDAGYTLGISHLTDLTEKEFNTRKGFKPTADMFEGAEILDHDDIEAMIAKENGTIPNEKDWRETENIVSGVKDQGQCGSCWAFGTIGMLEGQEKAHRVVNRSVFVDDNLISLSEQELVDCDQVDQGCQGGLMSNALDFIREEGGVERETDYPYTGKQGPCKFNKEKVLMTENGYAILKSGDEELLKKTVATYGPVVVAIDASIMFQFYFGGVLNDHLCKSREETLNHSVLVVGYGTNKKGQDYWIVKNSWGKSWGDKGYLMMSRNKKNQCGIATIATIAKF